MAFLFSSFHVDDYDKWKRERFDADPAGRRQAAKGYRIFRSAEGGNDVFVTVEFDSLETAREFRDRLMASGALEGIDVNRPPTLVEEADAESY
jgi:hypothetical protein